MIDVLKNLITFASPALATFLGGPLTGAVTSFIAEKLLGNAAAPPEDIVKAIKADPNIATKLKEIEAQWAIRMKELDLDMAKIQSNEKLAQIDVNKAELTGGFTWRKAIGWTCAIALFSNFIVAPYLHAFGIDLPELELTKLMSLLTGLLGFGA
jgi:hypothetical protein